MLADDGNDETSPDITKIYVKNNPGFPSTEPVTSLPYRSSTGSSSHG